MPRAKRKEPPKPRFAPAPLPIPSEPETRTGIAPFPLTGEMTHTEFLTCWGMLSPRMKEKVRQQSAGYDLTLIGVLGRWPHLRVG